MRTLSLYSIQAGPQNDLCKIRNQCNSPVSFPFIFISAVCASPLYIGSSNNDIQVISKRRAKITPKAVSPSMAAFKSGLGTKLIASSQFTHFWESYLENDEREPIAGERGFYSYKTIYKGQAAIAKGIWATEVEENVYHEGFYLEDTDKLLAFVIDESQSQSLSLKLEEPEDIRARPKYIFIIKDDGYLSQKEALLQCNLQCDDMNATGLRYNTKRRLETRYCGLPKRSFLYENSYAYKRDSDGKWEAIFI